MLGQSDRGLILYRKMLEEQVKIVEDGGEPMNVFRDAEENVGLGLTSEEYGPIGEYHQGAARLRTAGPFSPVMDEIDALLVAGSAAAKGG